MRLHYRFAAFLVVALSWQLHGEADDPSSRMLREVRRISAVEAFQAVAVDAQHIYAISSRDIGKYDKHSGARVAQWIAPADSHLKHLNSGIVVDGKLYAAHSNWPANPPKNSIEIWNVESMEPIGRHEFSESDGAVTWIDRHDGHWWVAFAHYGEATVVSRTTLVQFDDAWRRLATYRYPQSIVERFVPFSNSGGSWGPDGLLHVTGHDRAETYAMRIPDSGSTLELVDTLPGTFTGQGIAWDHHDLGILYGIDRKQKEVVVSRLSHTMEYAPLKQSVRWIRDPRNPILPPRDRGYFDSTRCMNPWVVRDGDQYKLYYSGGDDQGRQRIGVATTRVEASGEWKRHGPLVGPGEAGSFDAQWCVLPHVIRVSDGLFHLYYTGNSGRGSGLSAFPGVGLATSPDGTTWTKWKQNPILQCSNRSGDPDAIGIAGGSVLRYQDDTGKTQWRFYYTGCPTTGKPLALNQQKTICLCVSDDGIDWEKLGAVLFRDPARDYENIGVAGPVVHRNDDGSFRMWYSAIGTRWGYYSICYAESDDGIQWRRGAESGDNLQLTPQGEGWEQQMVEYPSIVWEGDRLRMFYCGNGYGRTGIGTAISSDPSSDDGEVQ